MPQRDATGRHTLNGASVEGSGDRWAKLCSFEPEQKAQVLLGLFESGVDVQSDAVGL